MKQIKQYKHIILVVIIILLFSLFIYFYLRKTSYELEYTIDDFKVLEKYDKELETYYFSVLYKDKTYDYYRGGLYYGDLVKISAEKWHINFSINEDGLLRYHLLNDMTYEGVIFNTDYTLTKEGMLKDYYYDGQIIETKEKVVNTINVTYNVSLNKKETL